MKATRAILASEPGGPEVLKAGTVDVPRPGAGEVSIKVKAAGVNRPDVLQRRGLYPPPEGASPVLGLEVAGVIEETGENTGGLAPGDAVIALLPGGGYAERTLCDFRHVLPKPESVSFEEAAGFAEAAFTVWANLFEAGGLKPKERLFVHGATSGIGTAAVMAARAFGAEVYGTAGAPERAAAAEGLGFARCFDHSREDWAAQMREAGGCDVVLDMVGADYVPKNLSMLRPGGRHVSIAFLGGAEATVSVPLVMTKGLTITGSTLRARPAAEKARLTAEVRRHLLPLLADGRMKPVIDSTYPLSDAAVAHARMEEGGHVGKIVLTL